MAAYRRWIGALIILGTLIFLVPLLTRDLGELPRGAVLRKLKTPSPAELGPPDLAGLELTHLEFRSERVLTRVKGGRNVELTLDPALQTGTSRVMRRYRLPEAGVVAMDVQTGKILVYASHVAGDKKFDVNLRATAPAASIFKVVTGAALVERAKLGSESEQCYHGGRQRILAEELVDDPTRDKWCTSLGLAMGKSTNVVFARLALKHLNRESLTATAGALGFGAPVPFILPNDEPSIDLPDDRVEFARSAAGFWHTTLSPLAAASLAQSVAHRGVTLEPRIVDSVWQGTERLWREQRDPQVLRRALRAETAKEVTRMMKKTVSAGSAFKSFHDAGGRPYLPGIEVAGKTGTLTDPAQDRLYTWFIGFAPADKPEIAISALVVNSPIWRIKAPRLAREVLQSYFARKGADGVVAPE